jgi:hypothetical protein
LSLFDFERDLDLLELVIIPFDGDDEDVGGSGGGNDGIVSFVIICEESFDRIFDCESVELSRIKRLLA